MGRIDRHIIWKLDEIIREKEDSTRVESSYLIVNETKEL